MYVKNDDESESLVNFTVDDDEVVIHRVARSFVLRRGKFVACIQNRSFDGGGQRLDTRNTGAGRRAGHQRGQESMTTEHIEPGFGGRVAESSSLGRAAPRCPGNATSRPSISSAPCKIGSTICSRSSS